MIHREALIHLFATGQPLDWDGKRRCIRSLERIADNGYEFNVKFSDGHKAHIKTYSYRTDPNVPKAKLVRSWSLPNLPDSPIPVQPAST